MDAADTSKNVCNYPRPFIPHDTDPNSRRPVEFASDIFNLLAPEFFLF